MQKRRYLRKVLRILGNRKEPGRPKVAGANIVVSDEHPKGPQRPRPRIEFLSDLIFGLALSVGAISLVSSPPTSISAVLGDLAIFGFTFWILITMWLRYTRIMSVLPLESSRTRALNVILLFLVSIEPFLFNLVARPPGGVGVTDRWAYENATSTIYGLDVAAMFIILASFSLVIADEDRRLIPQELIKEFKREGIVWLVVASIFLISSLPIFFTISFGPLGHLRYYMWFGPSGSLVLNVARMRVVGRTKAKDRDSHESHQL
jgi:uncharacterized membrane protein